MVFKFRYKLRLFNKNIKFINLNIINMKKEYHSVHAIIYHKNYFLLQLRDKKKNIHFPNFWGLFGGKLKRSENSKKGIIRELREETNLHITYKKMFFFLTIRSSGNFFFPTRNIKYFFYNLEKLPKKITIFEGQKYKFFRFEDLKKIKVNPFDYSAISFCYYKEIKKCKLIPKKYLK